MIARTTCRVCDGELDPILSLGDHYVSDFILPGQPDGTRAPLELVLCRQCRLLQLKHTVAGELMYRNYWYRSGTNQTMREALADIARKAETLIRLQPGDAVLDIGCNDGTLLAAYETPGITRIGFDPAENLAPLSRKVADRVVVGFFDADALPDARPKIVTSIAMFYDLEEPRKFVADVRRVMDPNGLWIVQMSYLPLMLREHELGNVCHEHLEYYSLQSFEYLLDLEGFEIVDVEINDVNGGSLRAYIRRKAADPAAFADETYRKLAAGRVQALRDDEAKLGLDTPEPYREFAIWCERIKNDVVAFIRDAVRQGRKVYVYGASTKGNTVLQYYGLDASLIEGAAERNRDKWGRLTVGTHIPIVSEEEARAKKPDYFLVLPWHFLREFQAREHAYLVDGGRFIVPAPHFTLI
ncbi:MAG TPA: class I SAM-dependent methyltransferase [Thermoanaerobaculia bacterium]|nr:class I SAM-dependent methyltransferase [Thermoanaerobaculia bacterium]